jgi:hypothetical protein
MELDELPLPALSRSRRAGSLVFIVVATVLALVSFVDYCIREVTAESFGYRRCGAPLLGPYCQEQFGRLNEATLALVLSGVALALAAVVRWPFIPAYFDHAPRRRLIRLAVAVVAVAVVLRLVGQVLVEYYVQMGQ